MEELPALRWPPMQGAQCHPAAAQDKGDCGPGVTAWGSRYVCTWYSEHPSRRMLNHRNSPFIRDRFGRRISQSRTPYETDIFALGTDS